MANQRRMWELADTIVNHAENQGIRNLEVLGRELALLVLEEEREIGKMMNRMFSRGIVNEPDF
jgi:hypothetical protein